MKTRINIQEIIAGCFRLEREHQKALVDNYSGLLYVVCNRYLGDPHAAQDALQECWALIFKKLHTYDPSIGRFEPWVSTLTIRHCLNILAKRKMKWIELEDENCLRVEKDLQKEVVSQFSADYLLELVAELPEKYRVVFNMAVIDGYTHKEIASALNVSVINSRAILNRARKLLQNRIQTLKKTEAWVNAI